MRLSTKSVGDKFLNSSYAFTIASRTVINVFSRFVCAPPRGSFTISSINQSGTKELSQSIYNYLTKQQNIDSSESKKATS